MLKHFQIPKWKLREYFTEEDYKRFVFCERVVRDKLHELFRGQFRVRHIGYKSGVGEKFGPEDMPTGKDPLDLGIYCESKLIAVVEITTHDYSYSEETGDRPCKFVPVIHHKIGREIKDNPAIFIVSKFNRNIREQYYWTTEEKIKEYPKKTISTIYGRQRNYITPKEIWAEGLGSLAGEIVQIYFKRLELEVNRS